MEDTDMINIETNIITIDTWEDDVSLLLGFDKSLFIPEPIYVYDGLSCLYESYVDYLISKHGSPYTPLYLILRNILEDLKLLYEARGTELSYKVEPTAVDLYIVVIAYQA